MEVYKLEVLIIHLEVDTAPPVPLERDKIGEQHVKSLTKLITRYNQRVLPESSLFDTCGATNRGYFSVLRPYVTRIYSSPTSILFANIQNKNRRGYSNYCPALRPEKCSRKTLR